MANNEDVFTVAAIAKQALKIVQRGLGGESIGYLDRGFVASLRPYKRGGLHTALKLAGDDEIELYLHRV